MFEPFLIYEALEGSCTRYVMNWLVCLKYFLSVCGPVWDEALYAHKTSWNRFLLARWTAREKVCLKGKDLVHRQSRTEIGSLKEPRLGKIWNFLVCFTDKWARINKILIPDWWLCCRGTWRTYLLLIRHCKFIILNASSLFCGLYHCSEFWIRLCSPKGNVLKY